MKTYTTDEVIALVTQWIIQKSLIDGVESFPIWLKEKEQSEIPVKGQMIWVKHIEDKIYYQRYFSHIDENGKIRCWHSPYPQCTPEDRDSHYYDEYSITDPNQ